MKNQIKISLFLFLLAALSHACLSGMFAKNNARAPRHKNIISGAAEDRALETSLDITQSARTISPTANTNALAANINQQQQQQQPAAPEQKNQPTPAANQPTTQLIPASAAQENSVAPLVETVTSEYEMQEKTMESQRFARLKELEDEEDTVEFNFENASLEQLINYIKEIFGYDFITPDILDPLPTGEKRVKGNLITFRTNQPLSKKEAWTLFITFLDMAGFALVPDTVPKTYRIMSSDPAKKVPLPTYINVSVNNIPPIISNSDQLIRYIYFIENSTVESLEPVLAQLKNPQAEIIALKEHNALLFVDKAYNIVNLMQIIKELDKVSMPQAMSVLKLRRADADEVKKLYDALIKPEEAAPGPNRLFQRKQPTSLYFPENVKILTEPRTNSLILLGPIEAIKRIEDFVIQYVDVELNKPFSPLYTYQLQYASATTVANIMNEVTKYGDQSNKEARAAGGVRGVDKFLKPMQFTAEPATNKLVIKADYEDYLKTLEIIKQLDEPQPQVAIEVLILTLDLTELKALGAQMRSQACGLNGILGNDVKFQTSGLFSGSGNTAQGIVQNTTIPAGVGRLLGDLIGLASGTGAGNTLISLGDSLGVWTMIQLLESLTSTQVVANPFLLTTNKTKADVVVGVTERVQDSQIIQTGSPTANTYKDEPANLELTVTPLINSDGMISLDITVKLDNFIGAYNPQFVQKIMREVRTNAIVADKEVIAIGGLIQNSTENTENKVPVLGDIPLLGWFFKNKQKIQVKSDLLILIGTQLIKPEHVEGFNNFTRRRINIYEGQMGALYDAAERRDPIHRFFFENKQEDAGQLYDDYLFTRHKNERVAAHEKRQRKRRQKKQQNQEETPSAPAKAMQAQMQPAPINKTGPTV